MAPGTNLREQRIARAVDREIAPVWHARFARLLWRHLPALRQGMVLDVHSGVGNTLEELLTRLPEKVRVLGLEPSEAMRALAKSKMAPAWKNRVYLKAEDAASIVDMGEGLYDLVVANLVLSEAHDLGEAIEGLMRVTKPGGTLLASLQMYGTWGEAEDLLREVMRDAGLTTAQNRLRRMANLRPTGPGVAAVLRDLGLSNHHFIVEQERFNLLFGSGREFLFSPLVEQGPLRLWKAVVGSEGNPQEVFFRFKEAIDAYCNASLFRVSAVAGAVVLQRPAATELTSSLPGARYWQSYPTLDSVWTAAENNTPAPAAIGDATATEEEGDIDIDLDDPASQESARIAHNFDDLQTGQHKVVPERTAEDDALLALLEEPTPEAESSNLDALLDQVLEFDAKPDTDGVEELDADELELIDVDAKQPGQTLERLRALLPPLPRTPPPPPKKK